MANKQIIINGVDVSGCVAFKYDGIKKSLCRVGGITSVYKSCLCADNSNCYYKQLKRKEQECEELKKERDTISTTRNKLLDDLWVVEENLKDYTEHFNKASDELDQLKAEKDELKTMLKDLSYENQKFCYQIEEQTKQLEPFKDEYFKGLDNVVIAELAKKSIRITAENRKLEQTLAEIKEIAEENLRIADSVGVNGVYRRGLTKQIIQKISECEVEND